MSQDPVSIDELRHDLESSKRRVEQDRLEAEFRRDPDWELVAEHLTKRGTVSDICYFIFRLSSREHGIDSMVRVQRYVRLAIEQCAREYAERNVSI